MACAGTWGLCIGRRATSSLSAVAVVGTAGYGAQERASCSESSPGIVGLRWIAIQFQSLAGSGVPIGRVPLEGRRA